MLSVQVSDMSIDFSREDNIEGHLVGEENLVKEFCNIGEINSVVEINLIHCGDFTRE